MTQFYLNGIPVSNRTVWLLTLCGMKAWHWTSGVEGTCIAYSASEWAKMVGAGGTGGFYTPTQLVLIT